MEVIDHFSGELAQLKLGRAQPSLLDSIDVTLNGV
jgi:ribosome recycling factor